MSDRITAQEYFMNIAFQVAKRSTCIRRQVGCVIVNKNSYIIGTGYNGVPKNWQHCIKYPCEGSKSKSGTNLDSCMAIHAEQNALLQCLADDVYEIYCTTMPCITCAKMISNTSCKVVYYAEEYSHDETRNIFSLSNINLERLDAYKNT